MTRDFLPLTEIFERHKGLPINKFPHHLGVYDRLFRPMLDGRRINLLEIGLGNGGSLQLWREYFGKSATITGVDIQDLTYLDVDAKVIVGDQGNSDFWQLIKSQIGDPHIIIDDGSHKPIDQLLTFNELFPILSDGGLYIIEDIHTSYRADYGGGLKAKDSFVERLKDMIDRMHSSEWAGLADTSHIFSVQIYPNLAIIHKRNPASWGGATMRPA